MTMQQRPFFVPNIDNINLTPIATIENNLNNTGYIQYSNDMNQNYQMIEKRPRMINMNTNNFHNNNRRDIKRSWSQPSQDNLLSFSQNKNDNIDQPNSLNNIFQVNQNKLNSNSQRFPYDRKTQRTTKYNKLNILPNSNNSFVKTQQSFYNQNTYSYNNTQPLRGFNVQNDLSRIQAKQNKQRYFSKIEQGYIQINKKGQNQSQQLRQQITIIFQPQDMQSQLLKDLQLSKSQQINQLTNNQQLSQSQKLRLDQGITNSLTNNQPFIHQNSHELQHSRTQMIEQNFPFRTQISAQNPSQIPSLNGTDISQKLISLAKIASLQNEANPNYNNLQAYTLEQQNQEL